MMKRAKWKDVLYCSLHIVPVIIILVFTFTDVLYNFKEPVSKTYEYFELPIISFCTLVFINIVLKVIKKIFKLPKKRSIIAIVALIYLFIWSFVILFPYSNDGMQFYSPDKTSIITFEENYFVGNRTIKIKKSLHGIFSVPIYLEEKYHINFSRVDADFKWIDENNLYVKIYPEEEQKDYPPKYYNIIDLDRSEIISKEQYENLKAEEYSFKPIENMPSQQS